MKSLRFGTLVLLVCVQSAHSDGIFVAPSMVVRDNGSTTGTPIGPVVGFMQGMNFGSQTPDFRPIIRIVDDVTDPTNPVPVFVAPAYQYTTQQVDELMVVPGTSTLFTSSDCTGDAYHLPGGRLSLTKQTRLTMPNLTGVHHSIARRGTGANMELFASKLSDPTTPKAINSAYHFVNISQCDNENGDTISVIPATAIKTLNFLTPFVGTAN